jgi:CheY-like chemotaxis protein
MLEPTVLDLNDVVRKAESMLRRVIGEDVLMAVELASSLPSVTVDRGQIEQVILNLVLNARDSMPSGGRMTIATSVVSHAEAGNDDDTANYVELSVADTGHGMSDEVKARIFDPFFTTKELGKGTGLGLAVVHGIVSQSGGRIDVESRPGAGSRFRILLPIDTRRTTAATVAGEVPSGEVIGGRETILVVEDDEAVRQFAIVALEEYGFRVLSAKDGPSAIELVRREPSRIELLLSDVVMPELSGPELASILRRNDPQLKVLYVSGYADDDTVRHGLLQSSAAFMHKPYAPQSLVRKVREVLDDVSRAD